MKRQAYEGVLPFSTVMTSLYYQKLHINPEAELELLHMGSKKKVPVITGCHRLCMPSVMKLCIGMEDVSCDLLRHKLNLCAGDHTWTPMKLNLDVECLLPSSDGSLIYWASGSRGLVVGSVQPNNGKLFSHILAENPTPESGLFANRRGRPVPIYVGHATAMALSLAQNKLWVGTENGLLGSVYVFQLPDMNSHHYIHLQDAVLSLQVVNTTSADQSSASNLQQHQALVGLANGSIILFYGVHQGRVLDNPLQGPRKFIVSKDKKPCLAIHLTNDNQIWCSCGNELEVFDLHSLKPIHHLTCQFPSSNEQKNEKKRGDVITLMLVTRKGVWTVARRSSILRLWNSSTGELKATFNVK